MRTLVVVTGRMRSGTSLVAQLVHRMGFPVCLTMTPPLAPQWDSDWEEVEALPELLRAAPLGLQPTAAGRVGFARWFRGYLLRRFAAAEGLNEIVHDIWGVAVKSPLYALLLPEVRTVAGHMGLRIKLVECERPDNDVSRSLAVTHGRLTAEHLAACFETNQMIDAALDDRRMGGADLHIADYPRLVGPAPRNAAELGSLADYLDRPLNESLLRCVYRPTPVPRGEPCLGPR